MHSGLRKRSLPTFSSLRREGATRTSMGPPPQAEPGLDLGTWQDSPLLGNTALPPVIPHDGTKLGAPSQRWGMGWSYQTHRHTRTGSETKGKSKAQLIPLRLHRLNHYPLGVWGQCLQLKGKPQTRFVLKSLGFQGIQTWRGLGGSSFKFFCKLNPEPVNP